MAYSGVVRRILVSCPGDVPDTDLAIVRQAINQWNGVYGEQFGTAVIPIWWGHHAAAEYGEPPQAILNRQLVDSCDGCIAMFANRLGTETANAESGTAEEIQRFATAGSYVAILHSTRHVDPSKLDYRQASRLEEYLSNLQTKSLILRYSTDSELYQHVGNILVQAVSRDTARAELQLQGGGAARYAEVWPRLESSEKVNTDSRGRVRTQRTWHIVLHNAGSAPARKVRFRFDDESWKVIADGRDDEPDVAILAPQGEARFVLLATYGTSSQTLCTVAWEDDRGPQENSASLRLA